MHREDLNEVVEHLEDQARMILPGIQALFGFQLIAVFNQRFGELSEALRFTHFAALIGTAIAITGVLAPAAFHRLAEPGITSRRFAEYANRWMSFVLAPLMLGMAMDIYVIGRAVGISPVASLLLSLTLFFAHLQIWYLYPIRQRSSHRASIKKAA